MNTRERRRQRCRIENVATDDFDVALGACANRVGPPRHAAHLLAGVVQHGTAAASQIRGVMLAGKTGTAQNAHDLTRDHAWFVGFAPANDAKIVVAVMLEYVPFHGAITAQLASKIIGAYLHVKPVSAIVN